MSHESVITSLKGLIKYDLLALDPTAHANHIMEESERTSIILSAATIEDMLVKQLVFRMPSINSDERDRLFNFEGPCGSFANRIRMAQALGIIDRPMRKRIEIIKEMRNAAAHSHVKLSFKSAEIQEGVAQLFPAAARDEILAWPPRKIRAAFTTMAIRIASSIAAGEQFDAEDFWLWLREQKMRPQAFRGKSSGASPRNRPKGRKGTRP